MSSERNEISQDQSSQKHKSVDMPTSHQMFDLKTTRGQVLFLAVTVAISYCAQVVSKDTLSDLYATLFTPASRQTADSNCTNHATNYAVASGPKYAIYGKNGNLDHLKHVEAVLYRLGLEKVLLDDDWDVLWAHDYPYRAHARLMKNLRPHQKVNHFPGCGYITSKLELSTTKLDCVPQAFKLPQQLEEFLEYSEKHPDKLFVQKHNEHRHIKITRRDEVNLNANDTFIQEFIHNPYLVDGYKFDIGVYVIITSVDPLRVYMYKGDVLFRYCPEKYHPFDSKNLDKYVVGDDYLPTWEVPALASYFNDMGFGMKDSFDAFVISQNKDPNILWANVEKAIMSIIMEKEKHIIESLKHYRSKRNFFEMIRFDLIIDDKFKAYAMEANMSPNLSSAHFKMNTLLYEQVLYSLFNLVGIGMPIRRNTLRRRTSAVEDMISAEKNIMVNPNACSTSPCSESCESIDCKLCKSCLSDDDLYNLHTAYREHVHRSDTKRLFPAPIVDVKRYDIKSCTKNLSASNQIMAGWFYAKCLKESSWCS